MSWHWTNQSQPIPGVAKGIGAATILSPTGAQLPFAFVVGGDGHLWYKWWNGQKWEWIDRATPHPTVSFANVIGVFTAVRTSPFVYLRGTDGNIWAFWWDGGANNWRWEGLGSGPASRILVADVGVAPVKDQPNTPERPYIFVLGDDGHLWLDWWDGSRAYNWEDRGVPKDLKVTLGLGALAAAETPTGPKLPHAFVRASDGHLWLNRWDGKTWQWQDLGAPPEVEIRGKVGVITVQDSLGAPERPYVFVRGSDGNLWLNWWNGQSWQWSNQGQPAHGKFTVAVGAISVKEHPDAAQYPYAFVADSDGHLWTNRWNGTVWSWDHLGKPGNQIVAGGVGVVTVADHPAAPQRPYVFVIGSDRHLWLNEFELAHLPH